MKEKISPESLNEMCHGCMWQNTNGHCKLINVTDEVQLEKYNAQRCDESIVFYLDQRMLPMVEVSMTSATRRIGPNGNWIMEVNTTSRKIKR